MCIFRLFIEPGIPYFSLYYTVAFSNKSNDRKKFGR